MEQSSRKHKREIIVGLIQENLLIPTQFVQSVFLQPPPKSWLATTGQDIILMPGHNATERIRGLRPLGQHLVDHNFRVHHVTGVGRNLKPTFTLAKIYKRYILKHNLTNIVLLAHSKGGLIAKVLLDDPEIQKRIDKAICICTPYGGTPLAVLRFGSAAELLPGSKLLEQLLAPVLNNHKIYNFYPLADNMIPIRESMILEGAQNKLIQVVGHNRILLSKQLWREIDKILD